MKNLIYLSLILILGCACSGKQQDPMSQEVMLEPPPPAESIVAADGAGPAIADPQEKAKKIIRSGSISLQVTDIAEAKKQVDKLVKANQAYYDNENISNEDYAIRSTLKIRIPSANFERFAASAEHSIGELLSKDIHSEDVSRQFVDLETRLTNKRSYLARYRELLSKASSVKDILEIQESLRKLEEELESTEKQLKMLSNQVSYSTLDLELLQPHEQKYRPESRGSFAGQLKSTFIGGWYNFIDLMLFLIKLWPFWLLIGIIFLVVKRIRKKRHKNHDPHSPGK